MLDNITLGQYLPGHSFLHRMDPRRIVYVSCDPATLARDVALLKERGYQLQNAMAADLFPRCAHVESVCTLIREEAE